MINEASKWRLAVAQKLASVYAENPKVKAAILGGSASRGCADCYSDIDMGMFWSELPDERERLVILERFGGGSDRFNQKAGVGSPRGARQWGSGQLRFSTQVAPVAKAIG